MPWVSSAHRELVLGSPEPPKVAVPCPEEQDLDTRLETAPGARGRGWEKPQKSGKGKNLGSCWCLRGHSTLIPLRDTPLKTQKKPNLGPGPRGHSPGVAPSPPSPSRSQLRGRCSHPKSPQRPQKGGGRERFWGLGWAPPGRGHDPELLGHRTQALGLGFGVVLWGHGVGMRSGAVFWGHGVRVSSGCCHAAPPRKE